MDERVCCHIAGVPRGGAETSVRGGFQRCWGRSYDVTEDGQRFLVLEDARPATVTKLNVVVNWFEELKRLVPTGN